ncbi:integrase catalytic domain-containing protein [Pseudobutyrivibrio xylanivorans]|uniref:Transposase family protein n=1 Tax=Pseudobutyrivibrio xylanivorans TaxID=185007 RepID=A0A5P6VRM0_PSEXY|nr:Mu transposase C-terminal domain-containing protein [Pseudobutyrivibrio xylanivorans]QFJ54349.1 transposase family protein [Pseudobutyrivibrio xylanivorans]
MQKNELYSDGSNVYRVIQIEDYRILVIDCIKETMPMWIKCTVLDDYKKIAEEELPSMLNISFEDLDTVDSERRKVMYQRFALIADLICVVGDIKPRNKLITKISTEYGVSKQSIRSYLCKYLVYQNIQILLPKKRQYVKDLSEDEKNIRWSLNKYFYSYKKNTLRTAYTLMLKEKYCDSEGRLVESYPSFYQYRYFYRKTRKMQNYYISREGLSAYQRNKRPCIGDGVQQYAQTIGTGMVDATVCDIYLVNEFGQVVGRPILTACIDAFSGICYGYSLSWKGGIYSIRDMCQNIITNKVEYCRDFGINISAEDWDVSEMPLKIVSDQGAEYVSYAFEQLSELGITIVNLPPYRPELKGPVEKFFDIVQNSYKKYLKGYGVIEPDFNKRGAHDYRKDAVLTMKDFSKIILKCIIHYNSKRLLENYPFTDVMIEAKVKPYANCIWNYEKRISKDNLLPVSREKLTLCLLPRTIGKFTRYGMIVNKLRYHNPAFTEEYLSGGDVIVAYDTDSSAYVWMVNKGDYIRFELIEGRFKGKSLAQVQNMQELNKKLIMQEQKQRLQADIDLANSIQVMLDNCKYHKNLGIKDIRSVRSCEEQKNHNEFAKEAGLYEDL